MPASRRSSALVMLSSASGRPRYRTVPPVAGRIPASTSSSSDWPLPATPGHPEDLAGPQREADRPQPLHALGVDEAQVLDLEQDLARLRRRLLDPEQHPPPDHSLGELRRARLGGHQRPHHLAAPHDADRVGHRHDLPQLVGDQDDRLPLGLQVLEDAEQVVGLGRGQHARRLVEDQDVALAVERLQDLDPLLQPDRELADHRVGVDLELVLLLEPLQLRARLGERRPEQPPLLGAEHHVLEHGERLDQHEVLVDHADPRPDRRQAVRDRRRHAVDADLARVGVVEAVEDRHQRRLAGAVLADDAVDRPLLDPEVDVLVGLDRPEALGDADELDGRGRPRSTVRRAPRRRHRRLRRPGSCRPSYSRAPRSRRR